MNKLEEIIEQIKNLEQEAETGRVFLYHQGKTGTVRGRDAALPPNACHQYSHLPG
jgi:hypothetical protein